MMSAARFSGVTVESVLRAGKLGFALDLAKSIATAYVKISGVDYPAPSPTLGSDGRGNRMGYIFRVGDLIHYGALLVTEMNGAPLPSNHGAPVRLVLPRWYGCTCIKWLNEIALVSGSERATPQMEEFAGRTGQPDHIVAAMTRQRGTDRRNPMGRDPKAAYLAYDDRTETFAADQYRPALMHRAATPIRVERYVDGAQVHLRIIGISWGVRDGDTRPLLLRFRSAEGSRTADLEPVSECNGSAAAGATWSFWTFDWTPPVLSAPTVWAIQPRLTFSSPSRLDSGYYDRYFQLDPRR
jgi:DMSO/TMAO reductase YedYZ molybdopterin-dependent catalytic subunit